jgi:alpha-L-fucosidase 2
MSVKSKYFNPMNKLIPVFCTIILLLGTGCSRNKLSNQDYVARYKGVFTQPAQKLLVAPQPLTVYLKHQDGPLAGNGDVGIIFGGDPDSQTVYLSKVDFWKSLRGFPEGGPFHPGGLTIKIPELRGASFYAEQIIANGTIKEVFKTDGLTFYLTSFVPDGDNSVILEMVTQGTKECQVDLDLWAQQGHGSKDDSGEQGGIRWVSRSLDSPDLDWPSHIVMAMKTIGAEGSKFTLKPSIPVYVVVTLCTNHDTPDYSANAIKRAAGFSVKSIDRLRAENNEWWKNFWAESLINIGDSTMEKYYYGSQYILASCSRNTDFPPGMWGVFLTADATIGDYHTNYNYQSPWWASYSSNHIGITEPYDTPILEYMEEGKRHAKEILDCRGVYYPVGIGPKGFCSSMYPLTAEKMMKEYGIADNDFEGGYMFCGQRSNALFCAANMFMRFYSTYDKQYAEKVYPFLIEAANFWEDYLTFENGRYSSINDNFYEVGPWGNKDLFRKDFENGDINPTGSLGLIRMLYKGIIDLSDFLGTDSQRHEKWNHILANLSPIPVEFKDGLVRVKACETGMNGHKSSGTRLETGFGRVMAHALVFPGGVVGEYLDPEFTANLQKEIARWDLEDIAGDVDWDCLGNGFETFFATAARLGYDPERIYAKLAARIPMTALPNLMVPQDGGGLETVSGIPACINEMLLQSYEGLIRVFPNWLPGKDASFSTLRAYGAFLVSSEKKNNEVSFVEIISEKGRECKLLNPWKTGQARISAAGTGDIAYEIKDNCLIFKTEAGKKYVIKQSL